MEIMMAGPMVRRLLDGTKTQTRRTGARWLKVKPGNVLHVREAFRPDWLSGTGKGYLYRADNRFVTIDYSSGDDETLWGKHCQAHDRRGLGTHWTPAVHMPLDVCRMRLLVKRVWQERANDISEADAIAEGMDGVTVEDLLEMAGGSKRKVFSACLVAEGGHCWAEWWKFEAKWEVMNMRMRFRLVLDVLGAKPDDMVTAIEFEVQHVNR